MRNRVASAGSTSKLSLITDPDVEKVIDVSSRWELSHMDTHYFIRDHSHSTRSNFSCRSHVPHYPNPRQNVRRGRIPHFERSYSTFAEATMDHLSPMNETDYIQEGREDIRIVVLASLLLAPGWIVVRTPILIHTAKLQDIVARDDMTVLTRVTQGEKAGE